MERKPNQQLIIRQSSVLLSIVVLLSISACATSGLQDSQPGLTHLLREPFAVNDDLCKASHDGNFTAVKNLIAIGADVNARYGEGVTPLIYSAIKGHTEIAKFLIDNGADVNAKDNDGWTALAAAANVGRVETARLLIEKGADLNAVDKDGYSVLVKTASMPFPEKLEILKLLINKGADVNARSKEGWTALMEAAKGHGYLTKGYIDKGHKDVAMVPTEFAKLLIERGSEVNARDMSGRTALMIAAGSGQTETIKILIEKGADVNTNDLDDNTALMYLIAGYTALKERLSKAKLKDDDVATIPAEIAILLVSKGIDVNAKKKDGVTALMMVASAGINEIVRLLIEKGADVNAKTNDGLTAFSYAATKGHTEIAKLLEQAGGGPVPSPIFSLKERLRFEGFSILPPQGNNWSSMDSDTKGIILERRHTGKKIHTILASVRIKEYTNLTIKGRLELLQYVKKKIIKEDYKDARFKPIDIKVSSECYLGGDCVRYDFTVEDHGAPYAPGSILILTGYGFFVVHPDANYIVDINYNQRFPKGDKPLPVEDEVEPFFKSLEFTPIKQKK